MAGLFRSVEYCVPRSVENCGVVPCALSARWLTCGLYAVVQILSSLNVARDDRAWPAKSTKPQSF